MYIPFDFGHRQMTGVSGMQQGNGWGRGREWVGEGKGMGGGGEGNA